ncbi:methyltransferase domain-containing protein [Candidatus Pacearchaeota archaeon]|nr:methyltransferase domain-containing protein [Candidatus Pacearchaeota archaeon]
MKLNLGCGDTILKGFVNVDIVKRKDVTVCNLDKFPLPWKNNSVDYIFCSHLLEHLNDPINFVLELHRISKPGAVINMIVPHFSFCASYAELSHKRPGVSYLAFGYPEWNKEFEGKFKVTTKLNFTRVNSKWLNHIFNPIINLSPILYERFFCYLLPCSEVQFRLKVIK